MVRSHHGSRRKVTVRDRGLTFVIQPRRFSDSSRIERPMAASTATSETLVNGGDPSVLRMAAPLVVSFWMRSLFTFVDTIYASTLGDASVAAIGLSLPFEFLMIAVWVGLSTGLTSNLARAMGARPGDRIRQYLGSTWISVLAIVPLSSS